MIQDNIAKKIRPDNITITPRLDNRLPYSPGIVSPSSRPVKDLQLSLITDRQKVAKTLKEIGVGDVNNFQEDVLVKILQRQIDNGLPKDKYGNEHAVIFVSDRDNSTAQGHDELDHALKEGKSFEEIANENEIIDPGKVEKVIRYHSLTRNMNKAQNAMLKKGIPVLAASGAVPPEAINRVHNGEPAPLAASWSTATDNYILSNPLETKLCKAEYVQDPDYEALLKDQTTYDKGFVLEWMNHLIENDPDSQRLNLRYQPEMDSQKYKYITSFHINGTKEDLVKLEKKVNKILNRGRTKNKLYNVKSGVDAEGSSKDANDGKSTQLYLNIEPMMKTGETFDGKDMYFQYVTKMSDEVIDRKKSPTLVTFGIADSNNDLESVTSKMTKGLAVVPSNAESIKKNGSNLQNRLLSLEKSEIVELAKTLKKQGLNHDKAIVLANNTKVVETNPHRFIFYPVGPDSQINLGINDGYQVLNALIKMGMFTRE
ncbi:MAG: hypothetical protein HRT47_12370 [Candidatus Caenarcaniphilales bacterium]|nr:hypothetical protein [Candidatus Caenarcaniphilales bacterium]